MSAQSALIEADVSGRATATPLYGTADSGGAGRGGCGTAVAGGIAPREPQQLNGAGAAGPHLTTDQQLPCLPSGHQGAGGMGEVGQLPRGGLGAIPVGSLSGNAGDVRGGATTGAGHATVTGLGATSRRVQGSSGLDPDLRAPQQQPLPVQQQQPGAPQQQPIPVQQQQPGAPQQQPLLIQQQQPGASQQPVQAMQPRRGQSSSATRPMPVTTSTTTSVPAPAGQDRVVVEGAIALEGQATTREAQVAMAQLTEQRGALISALHVRASRMLNSGGDQGGSEAGLVHDGEHQEPASDHGFWFARLRGMIQRGLAPVTERWVQSMPVASPVSWHSQSPPWSLTQTPRGTPAVEHHQGPATPGWNATARQPQGQLTEGQGDQSSTDSIPAEMVQEEVRRQVQMAMQNRDSRNNALQMENQELRQLLMEMIEADHARRGVGEGMAGPAVRDVSDRGLEAGEGTGAGSRQPPGQGEPSGASFDKGPGREPPVLPVQGRGAVRAPPGLEQRDAVRGQLPLLSNPAGGGGEDATGKPQGDERTSLPLGGEDPSKGGRGSAGSAAVSGEAGEHGGEDSMGLLAKGIQQLQQLQLRREGPEPELLKGSLELPKLPEPYQDTSAVAFLEWIYETGQVIGSITDKAGVWWAMTQELVMEAYQRYQVETPLKRLEIRPGTNADLEDGRWSRLDKRVMALLLPAMTANVKQEILMLRLAAVKDVLFKLYTVYAPGGAAERASLLKQLEIIPAQTSVVELIGSLRRWKKLANRAAEMGVALPDGSVLLVAIETAIKGLVDSNRDMAFKLNMAKQELQLPYRPTVSTVMTYADHVMAELQQIIPYNNKDAKLKGMQTNPSSPTSSTASPKGKGNGQPQPCKFWLSDDGCRRGSSCKYAHQFATKEEKKARCWTCGTKNHRQSECPTKAGNHKKGQKGGSGHQEGNPQTSSTTTPQVASLGTPANTSGILPPPVPTVVSTGTASTSATSTLENPLATAPTTSSSEPSSAASTILFNENTNTGEIRELAEQFLAKIKRLAPMQAQTDGAVMDLELLLRSQGLGESHGMALLDSGASHPYRAPRSLEEAQSSRRVKVQPADGKTVSLRQNTGGTLLAEDDQGGIILPLGSLVTSLGCELEWSRKRGLQVRHPKHGLLPTKLVGNTPVLREAEALQLIADLEDIELNKLNDSTFEGAVKMMNTDEQPSTWLDHLEEYVNKGERKCLRRMLLDEESPLQAFTEEDIAALIGHDEKILLSDEAGAHYLKALPYNRAHRKRLLATRWIVHMYNGDESGHEFAKAESDDVTVIRMDIRDSKAFDLKNYGPAARALMWAAARGQIEGVIGAPPRGPQHDSLLFRRMMMVWLVANSGAVLNGLCAPFFNMEAPTYHPVWTSMSWFRFKDELRFLKYHSLGVQGHMYFMASSLELSDGMTIEEAHIPDLNYEKPPSSWPSALKHGLAQAMVNWKRSAARWAEPSLCAMVGNRNLNAKDLAYWQNHINNNHVPYDKRCRTCVRGSATGRAHRRCLTPSAYTLSMDICGPMRTRGESPDGKKFRYLLVGAYSHPKLDLPKDYALPPVEEEDEIEAEMDPFEEEDKELQPDVEDDEEQRAMNERCKEIYKGIGDDIECQTLHFVVPMVTRTSKEVRAKIQQIYLQLRQHGLPLVRIHSDRGLELKAKETRAWMADRDILATTGESQQPQQNGRAEALVREIKRRVKVLLRAANLPVSCWPSAAEFAARRQRDLALGNYEDKDLPYGAPTHVKHKQFGQGGRYDLLERWREGTFVGYSNDVKNGRVVRHDDGSYTTSVHIKPYLFDPGEIAELGPHELELPVPERRVREKATISQLMQEPDNDIDSLAKDYIDNEKFALEDVVSFWEVLRNKAGSTTRASQGEGLQWMVGQYTYGGKCGVMRNTDLYPVATSYLVEAFKKLTGRSDFTASLLTENVGMKCHRDVHNHGQRNNLLLPLLQCNEGGGVWVESPSSEYDFTDEWKETPKGGWRRGRVHELHPGHLIHVNPRMYHATEPWEGRRLVVTAYTPRTSKMTKSMYDHLKEYGFGPPPLQPHVPDELKNVFLRMMALDETTEPEAVMFLVNEAEEEKRSMTKAVSQELQQLQEDVLGRLQERREWLKEFLAEEEILAEEFQNIGEAMREEIKGVNEVVRDLISDVENQIKVTEEKCHNMFIKVANLDDDTEVGNVEEYLSNLKKDLEVTLDVPLDQVKGNLDQWVEPMRAELANLEEKTDAIERRPIAEARKMEQEGKLILIPGKVVCTVKPPPPLATSSTCNRQPRWKRKARVVICGNLAGQWHDPNDLFASGASVEGLRLALAIAVAMAWCIASTDVSAAFLQARWPSDRPTYGVLPPKVLVQAGLVDPDVVFIVKRALYGLRESPALWAAHRTEVLGNLSVESEEGRIFLKQMVTDSELWMILVEPRGGGQPVLRGILVTYVDDLLYMGRKELIVQVHNKISSIWPCSSLEFADGGLRYLGMELVQEEGYVTLSQESYVDNLVRLHGLDPQTSAGLPCPKEWLQDEDFDDSVENFSDFELRRAQRVTGECLWLAYRTRPDVLFVTNYMAAMTSKKPVKVYHVGLKVISYLNATAKLKLRIAATADHTQSATADQTQSTADQTQSTADQTQSTADQTQSTADQSTVQMQHWRGGSNVAKHVASFRVPLSGYCDASYAPYGGKSYGCSMTMLGQSPVAWKAGKQPLVAMSVCEAELLEGSNCALLLESTMAMVQEILPQSLPPKMYIDNRAAGNILNGSSGSWRTRHLRIRHSYILDRAKAGHVLVEHIAGEDQPADLPTKMHSKARLLHLLGVWGMVGLEGLSDRTALEGLRLGCLLLVMIAIQSLAVAADDLTPVKVKEPLPVTGTSELLLLVLITCIAAVAVWEMMKATYAACVPLFFGTRRSRRIRKLRDLAKAAAEAEVERWMDSDNTPNDEDIVGGVRRALRASSSDPGPPRLQRDELPELPVHPRTESPGSDRQEPPIQRTPRNQRGRSPEMNARASIFGGERPPTPPVPRSFDQGLYQRERVVKDVLQLMTVNHLREALTQEGLPISGIKDDLVLRLGARLGTEDSFPSSLPTTRQYRYLLYIWRHRRLAGRTQIRWNTLTSREVISAWISHWKDA